MKKRHIRWDRVSILFLLLVSIISILVLPIVAITQKQKEIRDNTNIELITDYGKYNLNVDEFIKFKQFGELPELPKIELTDEQENDNNLIYLGEFKLTGYCNCEVCCGRWAGGPCANGEMPVEGRTIAVDTDIIPLNSKVYININGELIEFTAEDTGSEIIGNRIDIYRENHNDCFDEWCNCYADVYVEDCK